MTPFMLTVPAGTVKVPSPSKRVNCTMAFGCATPPTIVYPETAKIYVPLRVASLHVLGSSSASTLADAAAAIAAMTKPCNIDAFMRFSLEELVACFCVDARGRPQRETLVTFP